MYYEKDAKKKWCPAVRYLAIFSTNGKRECAGSYNRGAEDSGLDSSLCIASNCMMWRWADKPPKYFDKGNYVDIDRTGTGQWVKEGFCGLSGKP